MAHVTCGLWRGEGFEDDEAIVLGEEEFAKCDDAGSLDLLG